MKKRAMIIQAVILLAVSVVALTTAAFAWFLNSTTPKTEPFAVQVTGTVPLSLAFYRDYKDGNGYVTAQASESAPFVNDELLIPGEGLLCRVDVTNTGTRNASVSISLTGLEFSYIPTDTVTSAEALAIMQTDLTVRYGFAYPTPVDPNPTEPTEDDLVESRFLAWLSAENTPVNAPVVPSFALDAGSTARIYFRYLLSTNFKGINGAFALKATGISFSS